MGIDFAAAHLLKSLSKRRAVWGATKDVYSGGKNQKLTLQMTPPHPLCACVFFTRNASFHKSGSKGEDNINFQFIFCLSQKWDHCGNAVRTHESEYLAL